MWLRLLAVTVALSGNNSTVGKLPLSFTKQYNVVPVKPDRH